MVLLLLVAVPLFFSAGFILRQQVVKYQMRQQLDKTALQTVSLSADKAIWLNEKKELIIDGKLFDVKSWHIYKNKLTATGLFDKDEDQLNKKLKKIVDQKEQSQSPISHLLSDYFSSTVSSNSIDFTLKISWTYINIIDFNYSESIPAAPFLSDILPPKI